MQLRGSNSLLNALARYPVIFSPIGPTAMVAEAPDQHMGDLGRLEGVRSGLIDENTVGHRVSANKNLLHCFNFGVGERCRHYYFLLNI